MPLIVQTAFGYREKLDVYGDNFDTIDGTGVRDYIHVVDLALGHISAVKRSFEVSGFFPINLGTGQGYSVLEMLKTFEKVNNVKVPFRIVEPRAGDLSEYYADASLASKLLGWRAKLSLSEMCIDSWKWQKNNPTGFKKK